MSVTTSSRINMDTLIAALPAGVTSVQVAGAPITDAASKVITVDGVVSDATLQTAVTTAAGQFTDRTVNQATIQANIQTHIAQLETWLTNNPNGAVLTAAQTKFVAQTLVGVGRLLLGMTSTVGGAT